MAYQNKDWVGTFTDDIRTQIQREVRVVPVGRPLLVQESWHSGKSTDIIGVRFENTGEAIVAYITKGGAKKKELARETYKGSMATANNEARALEKAKSSVWRTLQSEIQKLV